MGINFGFKIRQCVQIEPTANNNFIVKVGCCNVSYDGRDIDKLTNDLNYFLKHPEEITNEYHNINCAQEDQPILADPA